MKKCARVSFDKGKLYYSYMTNIDNLIYSDLVLVDTKNGVKLAKFSRYTTSMHESSLATRWIYKKVDAKALANNLKCELEEEGISYSANVDEFARHEAFTRIIAKAEELDW